MCMPLCTQYSDYASVHIILLLAHCMSMCAYYAMVCVYVCICAVCMHVSACNIIHDETDITKGLS